MKANPILAKASAFAGALLALSSPSYGLIISDDVAFTVTYEASVLPNAATPVWSRAGSAGGSTGATIDANVLTLNTPLAGDRVYRIQNSSGDWDGSTSTGSTIEFSLQVVSVVENAAGAAALYFSTGSQAYLFQFDETGIIYGTGSGASRVDVDTTSDFQRYRITLDSDGIASLYVNNSASPVIANYAGTGGVTTNHIYFGDSGSTIGGISRWEYIAFTNAAAVAPIPEAGTVSMALLGGALLVGGRRWLMAPRAH